MRDRVVRCALAAVLAALPARAAAQEPLVVDRIAAVVGERIILLSEVDEEINQRRGQGLELPQDSAAIVALRRQVLDDLIDDEVIYQRARSDTSISVNDQEVLGAVEEQIRSVRGQFRTEAEFRQALLGAGLGAPEEYRRWLTDKQRRAAYQQRYIGKLQQEGKLRAGTVSEADLRRAYDEAMARQGERRRPPTITFTQIVVQPRAGDEARREAVRRADSVRVEIERGADFAAAARRFSDDVTTRENGGDLGFFRRGVMVRQFEEVAFAIRPGVVSPIVATPFGYHLIWVDRVQSAEVKARHILFAPAIGAPELAAARALADSLAGLVRAGASADSLARLFGDSAEPRAIGPVDRTQMDSTYAQAMAEAQTGAVVGPFALNPEVPTRSRFIVAHVTDVQAERQFTFDEVRDQLRSGLLRERGIRNLITDLRRQTYVDVRL
jgi:peptidyl-prolyl cis-trans isomerase SurA